MGELKLLHDLFFLYLMKCQELVLHLAKINPAFSLN